jgi:parafibromin
VFKHFVDKAPKPVAPTTEAGKKRSRASAAPASSSTHAAPYRSLAPDLGSWRGTPIILVPSSATSLINLYNAAAFLQDGVFVPPADARIAAGAAAKPLKLTIKRRDVRGDTCQYYIMDSVAGFAKHDW